MDRAGFPRSFWRSKGDFKSSVSPDAFFELRQKVSLDKNSWDVPLAIPFADSFDSSNRTRINKSPSKYQYPFR